MKTALNTLLFLVACAATGTVCADIREAANTLYHAGSFKEALEIYRHPEFSHDAAVQNRIGTIYLEPAFRNKKQSAQWFRKSAEQGNRYGQFNLGQAYKNGTGVSRDYAKAMQYFHQSASQGYAPAMNAIGALYEEGKGVEKDEDNAIQ
ncbi:sel1 repeat family protein [Oxalobacter vibrioformis]|uniref:Sel1 repeat family protein n=1 Tax=Oxalobacter vibrioformis TaxID=933080 RepID=A0A9E9LZS0_9BURK|nr:tetratricopeptide repeat protein [Oxalobacter vibrioformis]WAW09833.1 sel1 repeat family protein [Oxalobacter vibrioformis]